MNFKNKISSIVLFVSIMFTACDKKLDQAPNGSIFDEEAITDLQTLQAATIGIYDGLTTIPYYGRNYPTILELRGNNTYIAARNSNRLLTSYRYNYVASDADVRDFWNDAYKMLLRANNVINRADNAKDASANQIKSFKGEALFLRALGHFDLVRVFGKPYSVDNGAGFGVPIVTKFEIGKPGRNTVAEVYTQIIKDLVTAEGYLDPAINDQANVDRFRATKEAVTALLARVYLYKGDNLHAAQKSAEVINSGLFDLTNPTLFGSGVFWKTPGSGEEIFTIKISQFEDRGSDNYGQLYNPPGSYADVRVYPAFYNSYLAGDVRKNLIQIFATSNGNRLFSQKFVSQDNITGMYSPKLLRLAEMYFIHAEASVKLGLTDDAADDLTAIRQQRGLADYVGVPTLQTVLQEKNWEMAFEGHQWQDRLRNNLTTVKPARTAEQASYFNGSDNLAVTDGRQLFPIPQRELDANPTIKPQQNAGY